MSSAYPVDPARADIETPDEPGYVCLLADLDRDGFPESLMDDLKFRPFSAAMTKSPTARAPNRLDDRLWPTASKIAKCKTFPLTA